MFIIKIVEVTTKKEDENPPWQVIDERPYTIAEIDETGHNEYYAKELKSIRGYPPARKVSVKAEREVYKQVVNKLDLVEVINAVNQADNGK